MDGDTVASIEIWTSAGLGRSNIVAGIELTPGDCLALAGKLLEVVEAKR
jgi:hypothetical protein